MGAVWWKGLHILSMDPLLRGVSSFLNWYMAEALVKGFANFINGFFVKRGFFSFLNEYIIEALVKDLPILSMDTLLTGA